MMETIGFLLLVAVLVDIALTHRYRKRRPVAWPLLLVRAPQWWGPEICTYLSRELRAKGFVVVVTLEMRERVAAEWIVPPVNVTITTQEVTKKEVR